MSYSVEVRLPFLDYKLVDYANSLPIDFKVKNDIGKYILRESVKDILPNEIYESKNKMFSKQIENILGKPRKKEAITTKHKDIAASIQKIIEEVIIF